MEWLLKQVLPLTNKQCKTVDTRQKICVEFHIDSPSDMFENIDRRKSIFDALRSSMIFYRLFRVVIYCEPNNSAVTLVWILYRRVGSFVKWNHKKVSTSMLNNFDDIFDENFNVYLLTSSVSVALSVASLSHCVCSYRLDSDQGRRWFLQGEGETSNRN